MLGVAVNENGTPENGMGTAFGDINNDGWLDLTVTNYADQTNTLYRNDGDGFFSILREPQKLAMSLFLILVGQRFSLIKITTVIKICMWQMDTYTII